MPVDGSRLSHRSVSELIVHEHLGEIRISPAREEGANIESVSFAGGYQRSRKDPVDGDRGSAIPIRCELGVGEVEGIVEDRGVRFDSQE